MGSLVASRARDERLMAGVVLDLWLLVLLDNLVYDFRIFAVMYQQDLLTLVVPMRTIRT